MGYLLLSWPDYLQLAQGALEDYQFQRKQFLDFRIPQSVSENWFPPKNMALLILPPTPSFTTVPLSFHFAEERKPQSHLLVRGELTGDAQFEGSA